MAIRFAVSGFAGNRDRIKVREDTEAAHDRVDAIVEIRNDANFQPSMFQFIQNLGSFRKKNPTLRIAESVVHLLEELIKVCDHAGLGEDTAHDILPPFFLVFG